MINPSLTTVYCNWASDLCKIVTTSRFIDYKLHNETYNKISSRMIHFLHKVRFLFTPNYIKRIGCLIGHY